MGANCLKCFDGFLDARARRCEGILLGQRLGDELLFELAHTAQNDLVDLRVRRQILEDVQAAEDTNLIGDNDVLDHCRCMPRENPEGLVRGVHVPRHGRQDRLILPHPHQLIEDQRIGRMIPNPIKNGLLFLVPNGGPRNLGQLLIGIGR